MPLRLGASPLPASMTTALGFNGGVNAGVNDCGGFNTRVNDGFNGGVNGGVNEWTPPLSSQMPRVNDYREGGVTTSWGREQGASVGDPPLSHLKTHVILTACPQLFAHSSKVRAERMSSYKRNNLIALVSVRSGGADGERREVADG